MAGTDVNISTPRGDDNFSVGGRSKVSELTEAQKRELKAGYDSDDFSAEKYFSVGGESVGNAELDED